MVMPIILSIFLLFLGISVLIIVHVCIVGRALTLRRGIAATATVGSGQNVFLASSTSVSNVDLEKLPCFDFSVIKETSPSFESAECAVCLESFEAGQKCRLLPLCKHVFHAHCVDVWLLRTPLCPICRATAQETTQMGCRFN